MTKTFNVIDGGIVPPLSLEGSAIAHGCSDAFIARVFTLSGNERFYIVRWDFQRSKWISPMAGLISVIEYYID